MKDIATLLDEPDTSVAVVGATDNPAKYGYVIYRDLKRKGFAVFPVNPNRTTVDGDEVYATCDNIPRKPTVVNIVVPPKVTEETVKICRELGIKTVWMQPGSESEQALNFCKTNNINVIHGVCIMIERKSRQK